MSALDQLFLIAAVTAVVPMVIGNTRFGGWVMTLLYAGQAAVVFEMRAVSYGGETISATPNFVVLGQQIHWAYDALSWFFALTTVGSALFASWYASGEWGRRYREDGYNLRLFHTAMAANVFSMLVLLGSNDLLSVFIGWELVSWASFLLMAARGGAAIRPALRYVVYAMGGAMALMMGLAILYVETGSLQLGAIMAAAPGFSNGLVWLLAMSFGVGFGVKMGLVPFHLWQAPAYAETAAPGSCFFGAITARMGLFGIILILVKLVGVAHMAETGIPWVQFSARDLLAWVAALTIIIPTYTALRQHDARLLLMWHGVGQGGYMLLGLMVGSALGSAGGLLHIFNYATNQLILLMAVFAVIHRTGTADLNKLGGLLVRMPISFVVLLVGIIGLAGLPPMNGFVSKWMVYRALIADGSPLLFLAAIIGTLGTILSVYKLIHNIFLGQLRAEHEQIREVPWSMSIPMMLAAAVVFFTGYFPGVALDWVAAVQASVGLPVIAHTLGGVPLPNGGLNMIAVVSVLLFGFAVGAVIFFLLGGRSVRVHQLDNYAGGHFLTAATRYQYSNIFYPGLFRLLAPVYRNTFVWLEAGLVSVVDLASMGARGLCRSRHPAFYILLGFVLTLAWVIK